MTRLSIILTILLTIVFLGQTFSQESKSIVEGQFYYYSVTTPKGWIRDSPENLEVAFLPDKKSMKDGSNFAYANSSKIDTTIGENIQTVINFDQTDFKKRHPNAVYKKQGDIITTKDNKKSIVYHLTIASDNYYEAIAHIAVRAGVIMIVMHSKKENDLIKYLPKFEELVKSCFWVSEKEFWILPGK